MATAPVLAGFDSPLYQQLSTPASAASSAEPSPSSVAPAQLSGFDSPLYQRLSESSARRGSGISSTAGSDPELESLNRFRKSPPEELARDESFDPVQYYLDKPGARKDSEAMQKLTDVYKIRRQKPVEILKETVAFGKAVPSAVASFGRGIVRAASNVNDIFSAPVLPSLQTAEETEKVAQAGGELAAAADVSTTGLKNIASRALRSDPTHDTGWALQMIDDANAREAEQAAISGKGAVASAASRAAGVGAENLQDVFEGSTIALDPEAIADLSNVVDPTIVIPGGAAFKSLRATKAGFDLLDAAGKTVSSVARNSSAYKRLATAANAARNVAQDTTGRAVGATGRVLANTAREVGAVKAGVFGGLFGAAAVEPNIATAAISSSLAIKATEKIGDSLVVTGKRLRGELPPGRLYRAAAWLYDSTPVQGAVRGGVAALGGDLPTAAITALQVAGAEQDGQLGEILGSQFGIGATIGGVGSTLRAAAPYADITGQLFSPTKTPTAPVDSPAYNSQPGLDAAHTRGASNLPPEVKNRIDQFREAVRSTGSEIYVLSPDDYGRALVDDHQLRRPSEPLSDTELESILNGPAATKGVYIANAVQPGGGTKKVILLNSDGGALNHEGGHLLTELLGDSKNDLVNEVRKRYSADELAAFKQSYEEKLGQPITQSQLFDEILAENVAAVLNAVPIETLGTPAPLARKIYQGVGKFFENLGVRTSKRTALDLRPDIGLGQLAENLIRSQQKETVRPVRVGETPVGADVIRPVRGSRNTNIRVTQQDQNRFAGRPENQVSEVGSVYEAQPIVDASKSLTPVQKTAFARIGDEIVRGNGRPKPIEVDYDSIRTEEFGAGRTTRRGEQEAGYLRESLASLPEAVRNQVQKVLIPDRFEITKTGDVQLLAKSVDKVIANAYRIVRDAAGKNVTLPYDIKAGELTESGWRDLVRDIQTYTANQANGYAGNGKRVAIPQNYTGTIPPENTAFTPRSLEDSKANFINVLMALPPPKTTIAKGKTQSGVPANVLARRLAEANQRPVTSSVTSTPKRSFFDQFGVEIAETNPLRDQLAKAGVNVRDLIEVTERVNLSRIKSEPIVRNDLDFSRPSTDLIRAGFMPDPKKAVRVGDSKIRGVAEEYMAKTGRPYKPFDGYAKVDEAVAKRVADFYDQAVSNPADPAVQAAYRSLVDETKAQYEQMVADGYQIEPYTGTGEPYKSSAEAVADVRDNKHLYFLKTEGNFGNDPAQAASPNALLEPSGIEIDGVPLLNNDLFRAVHDFFGHAKEGYEFGPRGEYNAFLAHSTMFSDTALPALAAETLAQNSWVNYGPHLRDENGNIAKKDDPDFKPLSQRPFAEQKNVVIPNELINEAFAAAGVEPRGQQAAFMPGDIDNSALLEKYPEWANMVPSNHTLVEIQAADGTIYPAVQRGYWGPGMPGIGRYQPESGGISHGALNAGEKVLTPIMSYEEWNASPAARQYMPSMPAELERSIDSQALLLPSGEIFHLGADASHADMLRAAVKGGKVARADADKVQQGFVTKDGHFLGRFDALDRAVEVGQISPQVAARDSAQDFGLESGVFQTNRLFMPSAQRPSKVLPHAIGEGKITLLHRGGASGYKTVDPKFFGKSGVTPRSELSGENRSYFYEEGHENTGDITMGRGDPIKVEVYKNRIYDADEDALGWAEKINRWKADSELIDLGYVGVFRSRPLGRGKRFHQIELFVPTKVSKS